MKTEIIFKDRLKQLRKQAKLQQKELGEQIGLSANAISMMETGNRETSFEKLVMLAEYFHVSTDYLLGAMTPPGVGTLRKWPDQGVRPHKERNGP